MKEIKTKKTQEKTLVKKEFSCGAVLYTVIDGKREYVLIMEPNGSYGFPKGHRRRNETEIDCALREIKEETGIDANILPNFKRTIKYPVSNRSLKEVIYFVANYENQTLDPVDKNILQAKTYDLESALSLLKFPQIKDILVEIDFMLSNK